MTPSQPPTSAPTWLQITAHDDRTLQQLKTEHGLDLRQAAPSETTAPGWSVSTVTYYEQAQEPAQEPAQAGVTDPDITRHHITFALHDQQIITLQGDTATTLISAVAAETERIPASERSPAGIAFALLQILSSRNERTIESAMRTLDQMNAEVHDAIAGYDSDGSPLGVSDMRVLLTRMNDLQALLTHTQETQFQLLRATRQLRAHLTNCHNSDTPGHVSSKALSKQISGFDQEITRVKKYAAIGIERMASMHHSVTAMLEVKQHEIVKVFTIITAVFLPPTLIATFYGMNFENMPALATQHGFVITAVLTFVAAVIPLWYIKRKGWLR